MRGSPIAQQFRRLPIAPGIVERSPPQALSLIEGDEIASQFGLAIIDACAGVRRGCGAKQNKRCAKDRLFRLAQPKLLFEKFGLFAVVEQLV